MSFEAAVDSYLSAVKREGSIMGPVFFRLFSKYAVEYVAKKIGENPPAIEDLDGARNYILEGGKKCRECKNALGYGCAKAEYAIQGSTGPIMRRIIRANVEDVLKISCLMDEAGKIDAYSGAEKFLDFLTAVELFHAGDYTLSKDGGGSIVFAIAKCPIIDVCKLLKAEGIKRVIGDDCRLQSMVSLAVEFLLKTPTDFKLTYKGDNGCTGTIQTV